MTDFAPAAVPRGSLHAPLPPTSRLTLLRRRLTISGLAASSEADCALAGQIDRRRPGGSKLKSWFTSRSSGRQSSIGFEDDLQQNSMLSVGNTMRNSIIVIPGHSAMSAPVSGRSRASLDVSDPFAHPSPAFAPTLVPPLSPPQSPRSTTSALEGRSDYSMTSSHTRRAVAAATRAITLASRTKMPPFADTSYEVHPDASFPSYTSSHATRGFLADRHSKVPQNTPASRPSTHLRFNHTDENLHPASASASPSTPADDSFVHLSRSFLGLNERDLNSLPQPAFNANPPWQRLKSILQTITIADSPQDYVFENSMPNSPSPAAGASRSITPLTPPISPATTNTKLSPMSPSSPLAKFFFRPNPRSTSTPRSRSPRYNFTLPEFSTFDWMDAPSHRTWSTSVSLSDTEQSEGVARVCPALEALWMYESEEDDDFEVEEAPGDGSTGAGEAVPQEANAPDGNPLAKVDDMPDCSGSSRGLGLVVDFPLPPDRDVPKIGRTSGVGLPRPGAGVAEDSGVHAVHEPGRPSRHVATISDPSNARERQLLPSKFRPDLTPLAADGDAFPTPFVDFMRLSTARRSF